MNVYPPIIDAHSLVQLKKDVDLANKLGLRGTPAFVVGNEIIFGYVPVDELLNKIN